MHVQRIRAESITVTGAGNTAQTTITVSSITTTMNGHHSSMDLLLY